MEPLQLVFSILSLAAIQCFTFLGVRRCVPAGGAFWPCLGTMVLLPALAFLLPPAAQPALAAAALVLEPVCLALPFHPRWREGMLCFFLISFPFSLLLILCQALLARLGSEIRFVPAAWDQLPQALLQMAVLLALLRLLTWLPRRFGAWRRLPAWIPLGLLAVDRSTALSALVLELRDLIPAGGLSHDALLLLGYFSMATLILLLAGAVVLLQERRSARAQIDQLEAQRNMQLEYYRSLSQTLQEFRLLRHDLRHYLNLLGTSDANQELREKLQTTLDQAGQVELCGDPYLNAVLYEKMRLARQRQVRLEARAALDGPAPVDGPALICAASNLLENALEAARPGERVILTAACQAGMLVLEVLNPLHEGDRFPPRPGFSAKGGALHGLGLISVRRALEEAGGSLTLERREGLAVARAVLPRAEEG